MASQASLPRRPNKGIEAKAARRTPDRLRARHAPCTLRRASRAWRRAPAIRARLVSYGSEGYALFRTAFRAVERRRSGSRLVRRPGKARVEQQDAADEAGASHGASLLILVLDGPQVGGAMAH